MVFSGVADVARMYITEAFYNGSAQRARAAPELDRARCKEFTMLANAIIIHYNSTTKHTTIIRMRTGLIIGIF